MCFYSAADIKNITETEEVDEDSVLLKCITNLVAKRCRVCFSKRLKYFRYYRDMRGQRVWYHYDDANIFRPTHVSVTLIGSTFCDNKYCSEFGCYSIYKACILKTTAVGVKHEDLYHLVDRHCHEDFEESEQSMFHKRDYNPACSSYRLEQECDGDARSTHKNYKGLEINY